MLAPDTIPDLPIRPSGMRAREPVARLGEHEQDVLALIADGARNPDVASVLQLSPMKSHP